MYISKTVTEKSELRDTFIGMCVDNPNTCNLGTNSGKTDIARRANILFSDVSHFCAILIAISVTDAIRYRSTLNMLPSLLAWDKQTQVIL